MSWSPMAAGSGAVGALPPRAPGCSLPAPQGPTSTSSPSLDGASPSGSLGLTPTWYRFLPLQEKARPCQGWKIPTLVQGHASPPASWSSPPCRTPFWAGSVEQSTNFMGLTSPPPGPALRAGEVEASGVCVCPCQPAVLSTCELSKIKTTPTLLLFLLLFSPPPPPPLFFLLIHSNTFFFFTEKSTFAFCLFLNAVIFLPVGNNRARGAAVSGRSRILLSSESAPAKLKLAKTSGCLFRQKGGKNPVFG